MGEMGGGAGFTALTADLVARAVIAAAMVYGDDPAKACVAQRGPLRRCITPAAEGLSRATEISFRRIADVLGLRRQNRSRSMASPLFEPAAVAAMRAVEYALADADLDDADDDELVEVDPQPDLEPEPPAPPEVPRGALTPTPSRLAAQSRPIPPMALAKLPEADRPLRDLVLEALARGSLDSLNLASVINRKEMAVSSTLSQLEHEGAILGELVEGGLRRFRYRLAA